MQSTTPGYYPGLPLLILHDRSIVLQCFAGLFIQLKKCTIRFQSTAAPLFQLQSIATHQVHNLWWGSEDGWLGYADTFSEFILQACAVVRCFGVFRWWLVEIRPKKDSREPYAIFCKSPIENPQDLIRRHWWYFQIKHGGRINKRSVWLTSLGFFFFVVFLSTTSVMCGWSKTCVGTQFEWWELMKRVTYRLSIVCQNDV